MAKSCVLVAVIGLFGLFMVWFGKYVAKIDKEWLMVKWEILWYIGFLYFYLNTDTTKQAFYHIPLLGCNAGKLRVFICFMSRK